MRRWQAILAIVTGTLIAMSSFMHAFAGWPVLRPVLVKASVPDDVVQGAGIGWYLGSVSMFAFGAIVLLAGIGALRSQPSSRTALWVIALAYLGFGCACFVLEGYDAHFLLFALFGAMTLLSAVRLRADPLNTKEPHHA